MDKDHAPTTPKPVGLLPRGDMTSWPQTVLLVHCLLFVHVWPPLLSVMYIERNNEGRKILTVLSPAQMLR
jgi:hypothetical protein